MPLPITPRCLLLLTILPSVALAQPASPPTQKRLNDLRTSYLSASQRAAAAPYSTAVESLNTRYAAALDRAMAEADLAAFRSALTKCQLVH